MSRKVSQKKRVQRRPVVRETRSIAKDNSVIGVLTFVGVSLFLVLIGLLLFDTKKDSTEDYANQEVLSFVDNTKNGTTDNKTNNKMTDKMTDKNNKEPMVVNDNVDKDSSKTNNENEKNLEDNSNENNGGIPGLKEQVVQNDKRNNPSENTIENKNLSADDIYRQRYEAARRSGDEKELLSLAEWCQKEGMIGRSEDVYNYIIKISPDNYKARTILGYIRLDSSWVLEKNAYKLGYYKYDDKWMSTKELKDKGLYLYEDKWISLNEGKEKGLVVYNEELITKDELKEIKELEEEDKRQDKKQETLADANDKPDYKEATLSYRHIKIYSPPKGKWSTSRSGSTAQTVSSDPIVNANSGQGLLDTMTDAESGIVVKIQGFSPEILYTFADGSTAQGSEIKNLLDVFRGEAFNRYDDIAFQDIRRSRYSGETITQQLGVGTSGNKRYGVLLSLFRYETLTYSINIHYPIDKYTKLTEAKIKYLFTNMKKLGNY